MTGWAAVRKLHWRDNWPCSRGFWEQPRNRKRLNLALEPNNLQTRQTVVSLDFLKTKKWQILPCILRTASIRPDWLEILPPLPMFHPGKQLNHYLVTSLTELPRLPTPEKENCKAKLTAYLTGRMATRLSRAEPRSSVLTSGTLQRLMTMAIPSSHYCTQAGPFQWNEEPLSSTLTL